MKTNLKKPKFLRTGYSQYSKLGLRRKNKQKYKKSDGIDNKIRLKMKGHLRNISIGFRSEKKTRDFINGFKPVLVHNVNDLKKLKKDEIAIIAKIGQKNKMQIAEYALKNNVRLNNLNSKKFLDKIEEKKKQSKEIHIKKEEKKKEKEQKAIEKEKEVSKEENKDEKESKEESVKNPTDIKENVEDKK